jgi:hypothetical protein
VVSITPRPRFPPGERTPGTHWIGGWVVPRAGLDTEVKRKILCPCWGMNPDRPARSQTLYCLSYRGFNNRRLEMNKHFVLFCYRRHSAPAGRLKYLILIEFFAIRTNQRICQRKWLGNMWTCLPRIFNKLSWSFNNLSSFITNITHIHVTRYTRFRISFPQPNFKAYYLRRNVSRLIREYDADDSVRAPKLRTA